MSEDKIVYHNNTGVPGVIRSLRNGAKVFIPLDDTRTQLELKRYTTNIDDMISGGTISNHYTDEERHNAIKQFLKIAGRNKELWKDYEGTINRAKQKAKEWHINLNDLPKQTKPIPEELKGKGIKAYLEYEENNRPDRR